MKPLHILEYNGAVRPRRASLDEISAIITGESSDLLVHLTMSPDGDITTVEVTASERTELAAELYRAQVAALRSVLDTALSLAQQADKIGGVSQSGIIIWPERAPYAEGAVRAWAEEHKLHVEDEAPPTKPGLWIRNMRVKLADSSWSEEVVRMQCPSVEIGEKSVAIEGMSVGVAAAFAEPF